MADAWPANGATDWNTTMLAYLNEEHETDGTHGTKSGFQDRGDPASADYTQATLTEDGTWIELDLNAGAASVPTDAKAVLLFVSIKDGNVPSVVEFRDSANSNEFNKSSCKIQIAGGFVNYDIIVPCTTAKIDYNATNTTWTNLDIVVKGWWI